ncbi:UNVERIFIED_CONTAM: ubiquitin interaction motif domain-containing protein [Hammondia hammondi]|eukprot:XP_008887370.1 ubiquitin interaction motif domain-containing protein [Hammondia hammondi]
MEADQTPTDSRGHRERSSGRSGDEQRSEEDQEDPRGRREVHESRGRHRRCLDTSASEEQRRKGDKRRRRRGNTESVESRDEEETRRRKRERRRSEGGRNTRERTVIISDEDEDEELQLALALSASLQDGCECAVPIVTEEERAERDVEAFSAPVRTEKKREENGEDARRSPRREEALDSQEKNRSHTVDQRRKTGIAEARDRQGSCRLEGGVEAGEREEENEEEEEESVADTTRWDWRRRREDEERRREASQRRREAEFQTVRVQESNSLSLDASRERGKKEEETEKVDETSTSGTRSKGKAANASAERRSSVSEESSFSEGEKSKKAGRDREKRRRQGRLNASDALENGGTVRQRVDHGSVEEVEDDDSEDEDLQLALALSISEQHDVYHQCRLFSPRDSSETGEGDSASSPCKKLQAASPRGDVSNGRDQISPSASASQASPQESSESKAGVSESSERATNESLQTGLLSAAEPRDSSPQSDQRGEATSERDFMSSLSPPISPTKIRQKVLADDCDIPSNLRRQHPEAEQTKAAHASSETGASADKRTACEAVAAKVTAGNEEGHREGTQQVSEPDETTAGFETAQTKRGVLNYKVSTPTEGRFSGISGVPIEDGSSSVLSPASDDADSDFEPERRRPRRRGKMKEREKLSEEEAAVSESISDSPCSSLADEEMSKSPSSDSDAEDVKPKGGRRTTRKLGGVATRAVPARSRSQQTAGASKVKLQRSQQRSTSAEREKSLGSRCQEGGGDGREGAREREAKNKKGKERQLVKEQQRAAEREAAATAARLWKREKLQEACVYIWKVLTSAVASPVPLSFLRDQGHGNGAAKRNSRPGGGKLAALLHHAQLEEQAKIIPASFGSLSSVSSLSQHVAPSGQDEETQRAAGSREDERVVAVANPVGSSCDTTSMCPPGAIKPKGKEPLHSREQGGSKTRSRVARDFDGRSGRPACVRPFVSVADIAQVAQTLNLSLHPDEIQKMVSLAAKEGSPLWGAAGSRDKAGGRQAREDSTRATEKEMRALALYTEGKTYLSFEEFERFFHGSLGLKVEKNGKVW